MLLADVCFKVFHNSDCAQEQQCSLCVLRSTARGEQEQPRGTAAKRKAPEEQPLKRQLLSVLAVPAGHSPAPRLPSPTPVPAQPAASLQQRSITRFSLKVELLAIAHCLIGTKTNSQLPFPPSKINKLQCFKSEAFLRPLVYHRSLVAPVLSLKSCV